MILGWRIEDAVYENQSFSLLINFFNNHRENPQNYYCKNGVLKLLKKRISGYESLTRDDRSLELRHYGIDRRSYSIMTEVRPPILFYIERKFECNGGEFKKIRYKKLFIKFNWKSFVLEITGPKKQLKLIFLLASIY